MQELNISYGEMAYLALVLAAFGAFAGCVRFISIWSGRTAKHSHPMTATVTPIPDRRAARKAA